jgi:hypothetical protein
MAYQRSEAGVRRRTEAGYAQPRPLPDVRRVLQLGLSYHVTYPGQKSPERGLVDTGDEAIDRTKKKLIRSREKLTGG